MYREETSSRGQGGRWISARLSEGAESKQRIKALLELEENGAVVLHGADRTTLKTILTQGSSKNPWLAVTRKDQERNRTVRFKILKATDSRLLRLVNGCFDAIEACEDPGSRLPRSPTQPVQQAPRPGSL